MAKLRTFIDSGVLLAAFKAGGELAENALAVLGDPERQFVSSDFVTAEKPTRRCSESPVSRSRPYARWPELSVTEQGHA